uniref:Uncharacterized protein n=1 Tax=Anopheles maculatus TaxID=74869 RepID=A0A182SF48_9DIPT
MHNIRENATTESATHCLRYMPKDPRLRSTGRPDPCGTLPSNSTTTANLSSSSSSSANATTNTFIAIVRFRRAPVCARVKKNIRSNIRSIVGDATSVRSRRQFILTSYATDTLTCLASGGQLLLNGV